MKDTCVIIFGRMNPVHLGHNKLFQYGLSLIDSSTDLKIYVSSTCSYPKNPLPYDIKIQYIKKIFPEISEYIHLTECNLFGIMRENDSEYKNIILITGADRTESFNKILHDYNGKEYNYSTISVIDIPRTELEYSATRMRSFVYDNNFEGFKSYLPSTLSNAEVLEFFNTVKKYLI
jgi:nicotinamide mononucleotide adenylyltransferase